MRVAHALSGAYQGDGGGARAHGLMASGKWRGRYEQYGGRHSLIDFDLHVHPNGVITGSGFDDVGEYELRGFLLPCTQLAWASSSLADVRLVKYYRVNTGDPNENFGHFVRYAGVLTQRSEGVEIAGEWRVDVLCGYSGSGRFDMKPVGARYDPPTVATADGVAVEALPMGMPVTEALSMGTHVVLQEQDEIAWRDVSYFRPFRQQAT